METSKDEIYEKVMSSGILEQGIEQEREQGRKLGIEQGKFDMALKFKKMIGLDEATRISGFTKEELEDEILNRQ